MSEPRNSVPGDDAPDDDLDGDALDDGSPGSDSPGNDSPGSDSPGGGVRRPDVDRQRRSTMGTTGSSGGSGADVLTDTDEPAGVGGLHPDLGTGGEPDRRGLPFDPLPDERSYPRRAPGHSAGAG